MDKPYVVLALQGGGALGAYHIGVYEALAEAGYEPDWVTGISIGAINSAVVAGNEPGKRLAALEALWQEISRPDDWGAWLLDGMQRYFNLLSAATALTFGQPCFFTPRFPSPLFALPGTVEATSFYDTKPLLDTLQRIADFQRLNESGLRVTLGATKVTTGDLVFFDNTKQRIGPEHVAASGSLPPGFPPTEIDGELFWDGGCVSSSPLEAVLRDPPEQKTLVFMIDLWGAFSGAPRSIDEVLWRQKQIQYASRTSQQIESFARYFNVSHALHRSTTQKGKSKAASSAVDEAMAMQAHGHRFDIVHVVYHQGEDQESMSETEFSRPSISKRRCAGYEDMKHALGAAPWTKSNERHGATVHRCANGQIVSSVPTAK